ncbi:hypothetical protein FY046_01625 [Erwinia sp. 1181_3]|uniref:hypothetical protein n=1 Tax=Erwinia sp. 1181_3 TaxID=2605957 RepID=UPI004058804B
MNFEQHYEEKTPYITLDGVTPYANSMATHKMFLTKKFSKILKKSEIVCECYMNVCFEREQKFEDGQVLKWVLRDEVMQVYVIGSTKLFVKGKLIWAYCVGIIE